jgi:peptidoglycan/LPS O-acetylase OafA/YrhL
MSVQRTTTGPDDPGLIEQRQAPLRSEIRQLTGLRGIMALNVVLTHYGMDQLPYFRTIAFGNVAVDVFFCLSSFTLCLVYGAGLGRALQIGRYAVARFARVYPLFIITTLVTLWYGLALGIGKFPQMSAAALAVQFVRQASLLGAIPLPILGRMGSWNTAAWSVSIEAFCYVFIFPPLFIATRWARMLTQGTAVFLLIVLGTTSFLVYRQYFSPLVDGPFYPDPPQAISFWVPLIRGILMFSAGWLAYILYMFRREAASFIGSITNALAIGFVAIVVSESFGVFPAASAVMVAPFLVLGLMNGRSLTARCLASRPIHFLGVISYSLYLWHLPAWVFALYLWRWHPGASHVQTILWPLAVSLVVSTISFFLVEAPLRDGIKRLFRHRASRRIAPAGGPV